MTERLEVLSFRLPDTREKFHRSLGTMHRLKASVGPREQQRAFELAENGGGDPIRIVGLHSEAFESTFDFVLPQLECVAGRSAEDFGLCRGLQRGGRDWTTFPVIRTLKVRRHSSRDAREEYFGILRCLRCVGDSTGHGFPSELQGGLADFLLALWKMEIKRAARRTPRLQNVVQSGAVIALLAKQLGRGG